MGSRLSTHINNNAKTSHEEGVQEDIDRNFINGNKDYPTNYHKSFSCDQPFLYDNKSTNALCHKANRYRVELNRATI